MSFKKKIMEAQDLDKYEEEDIDVIYNQQGTLIIVTIATLVLLLIFFSILLIVLIISSSYYLFYGSLWIEWDFFIVFTSLLLGIISVLLGIVSVTMSMEQNTHKAVLYLRDKFNKK